MDKFLNAISSNEEEVLNIGELKEGFIVSPITSSSRYAAKSIWAFDSYDKAKEIVIIVSAIYTGDALEFTSIPLDEFVLNFRNATEVLASGEDGYAQAFRVNMKVKLGQ